MRRAAFHLERALLIAASMAAISCRDGEVTREASRGPQPPAQAAGGAPNTAALQKALDTLASAIEKLGGQLGGAVVSVPSGETLAEHDGRHAFNPASNAKLFTAAVALARLGPDHRFSTGLYGALRDGVATKLVLRGRGDPTLTTSDLRALVARAKVAGLRAVDSIVVDQSYYQGDADPPAYDQQPGEWAPFRAPIAAVSLDRNTVTVWFTPAEKPGRPATVVVEPPGFVDLDGSVTTGKAGSKETIKLEVQPNGDHLRATLSGSIPADSSPIPGIRRVADPSVLAGYALRAALAEQGIVVKGAVSVAKTPTPETQALAVHRSEPLAQILAAMGKDSDNFTAELVLLAIGADAASTSSAAGAQVVEAFLRERAAFDDGSRVLNGSGLFDANRTTAHSVSALLANVARDPKIGPELLSSLAIAGADGTLRGRLLDWGPSRRIRAKTGTLAGAVALSGYVLDANEGTPLIAFSLLVNGVTGKTQETRNAFDSAVTAIAAATQTQ
ncbi:MAG: D-alanyl-D-alanine carboxypeptidase/D-alanyl-D-alanine-endopeptidase [Polyangiaceae bacterium]